MRLRNNQVLYEAGTVRQRRGRNRVHGNPFRLAAPARPPDRRAELALPGGTLVLKAWHDLHLQRPAALPGTVIQVRMLRPDGSPRHLRPWWLFWTGPTAVSLVDLFGMYAWRFAIEHTFRFLKQHLGLNAASLVADAATERWVWSCLVAYWQLLLASAVVTGYVPPGRPNPRPPAPGLTPPDRCNGPCRAFRPRLAHRRQPPNPPEKARAAQLASSHSRAHAIR